MKGIVTGGGGFLGKALCFRLRELGWDVMSISRGFYPELKERGVEIVQADLSEDPGNYAKALHGADAVFHVAAKIDMWGAYSDFLKANVVSTQNILSLCREHNVRRLIYTSSPSVIADGSDLRGVGEGYPYPKNYMAFYPQTKAMAERAVLAANSDALWTLALRPHLIWGPGDTNLVPTILERARAGKLMRIGRGENKIDISYIEDCVAAHICALHALEENPACRGKAYFISQGEPVNLWDWADEVLRRNGLPPVSRSIPKPIAMAAAGLLELISACRPSNPEPLLSRFLVSEMATDHYFDISRARGDLGYSPKYSVKQALDKTFPGSRTM
jgi:2-alkyl-3-oxoalkanoate reductase